MLSGTVRTRDRLPFGRDGAGKVTAISVFDQGSAVPRESAGAGRIAVLGGLAGVRIKDTVGDPGAIASTAGSLSPDRHFAPPSLKSVVVPRRSADRGALHAALARLAEQDPLINLRQDELRQEISVSLHGEVQKEVIRATPVNDLGVEAGFRETTTICVERLTGSGSAVEIMGKDPNPFPATLGLRVDPAPVDSGAEFRLEVELRSMPLAFMKAVEDTVRETLLQGIHGWRIPDCAVTLTHSGYAARQSHSRGVFDKSMSSTGGDFRHLTPLVLMSAIEQAGTTVHEPVHRFRLELPADVYGSLLPVPARLRAVPRTPSTQGDS